MTARRKTKRGLDCLLCLFLPFLLGLVMTRTICRSSDCILSFFAGMFLLLLVPASVYGPLLSFGAFFAFGLSLGTVLGERGRSGPWTAGFVLSRAGLYLWIPVLFCLGQYGLDGSQRLRRGLNAMHGQALRCCLQTTLVQLAALLTASLVSRWLSDLP